MGPSALLACALTLARNQRLHLPVARMGYGGPGAGCGVPKWRDDRCLRVRLLEAFGLLRLSLEAISERSANSLRAGVDLSGILFYVAP